MQVEGDAEEAEDTLAGVTVGALRNWLRQVGVACTLRPPRFPASQALLVAVPSVPTVHVQHAPWDGPGSHALCRRRGQGRELSYQILGLAARLAPEALPGSPEAWAAALAGGLPDLHHQHLRLMERHILIPMLQSTPPHARCAGFSFRRHVCLRLTSLVSTFAVGDVELFTLCQALALSLCCVVPVHTGLNRSGP